MVKFFVVFWLKLFEGFQLYNFFSDPIDKSTIIGTVTVTPRNTIFVEFFVPWDSTYNDYYVKLLDGNNPSIKIDEKTISDENNLSVSILSYFLCWYIH